MLKQIEIEGVEKVSEYVDLARHKDDLWREPFLLAVAQKSGEDSTIASNLIRKLFETPQTAGEKKRLHDLLLAATCVIESKQETIDRKLQREIVDQLLQTYERAQRQRDFAVCQQLESVVKRWLLGLFSESYQPTALLVILTAVIDIQHVNLQIATLTMLSMIAQQLINGPAVIFKSLVPPLLALSGLPPIEIFHPDPQVSVSDNLNVADLALTALSFMGGPGPAGQLLLFVRQHFKEQPAQLRLLASNSLASRTLITPTVVPFTQENYKKYKSAIAQWIALRDSYQIEHITERDIDVCLAIHQNLLDCAEESRYPTAKHFISMLQAQADHPDELWQEMWRCYLLSQLSSGRYIHYQEVALLWAMLFPDKQELSVLTGLIWQHYTGNTIALQRNAQRFISSLSRDLRDLSELSELMDLSELRKLRDLSELKYLRELRDLLLSHDVMEQAIREVPSVDPVQYGDLLTIILGRILQIQETEEISTSVEREVQQAIDVAIHAITSKNMDEAVVEAALDILRYLPARSAGEVTIIRNVAESTTDARVHTACARVLEYARPVTSETWTAIELCKQSSVQAIQEAAEGALKRKK